MTAACGLQQAGDAQQRIAAQFQRIAIGVEHQPQNHIHRAQSAQGFQPDPAIAHHQIFAFHQTERQVIGEIGVFKINRAVRTRRQQHHMRIFGIMPRQPGQGGAFGFEKAGQPPQRRIAIQHRQRPRQNNAVLQRVARAGRRLGAVAINPKYAVWPPRQIDAVENQPAVADGERLVAGVDKSGVGIDQFRRQPALTNRGARPV